MSSFGNNDDEGESSRFSLASTRFSFSPVRSFALGISTSSTFFVVVAPSSALTVSVSTIPSNFHTPPTNTSPSTTLFSSFNPSITLPKFSTEIDTDKLFGGEAADNKLIHSTIFVDRVFRSLVDNVKSFVFNELGGSAGLF